MDKKLENLEKQNLENRIFVLGGNNPSRFFNTHQRVYEKINMTNYNSNIPKQYQQGVISDSAQAT